MRMRWIPSLAAKRSDSAASVDQAVRGQEILICICEPRSKQASLGWTLDRVSGRVANKRLFQVWTCRLLLSRPSLFPDCSSRPKLVDPPFHASWNLVLGDDPRSSGTRS